MKQLGARMAAALIGACLIGTGSVSHAGTRAIYSDDGVSEIRASEPWAVRPDISATAALRVADVANENYLIVNTYLPEEIEPKPLAAFAEEVSAALSNNLQDGKMSKARKLTINGRNALEYEISGKLGEVSLVYLSTVIEGKHARHHLIGWTLADRFPGNRAALRDVASSFRESAKPRAAKERINVSFNWPAQSESKFVFQAKQMKRGVSNETKMTGITRTRTLPDKQLLVSTQITDHQLTSNEKSEAANDLMQKLMQKLTSEIPDYVVSSEGALLRVENMPAYYSKMEQSLLESLPPESKEMRPQMEQLLRSLLSEEALMQSLQEEWNNLVGNWAGNAYTTGETYIYPAQYQSAALGTAVFAMTITQRLLGRVPCNKDDQEKKCVKLEQQSHVSDPSFTKAMHEFVNRTVKNFAGDKASEVNVTVDRAEFVKKVSLVADPNTLVPYEAQTTKTTTLVITENGRRETTEEINESVTRYAY